MAWLEEHEVPVMELPALSPDLNPIEKLWAYMQYKVYEGAQSFSCKRELTQKIIIWADIHQIVIDNLFASMPQRMDLVRKGKGDRI